MKSELESSVVKLTAENDFERTILQALVKGVEGVRFEDHRRRSGKLIIYLKD